jgi:soluble lytic murein transglycosylase-like protein
VFDTEQQKQSFAVLLAIESKFDRTAKSSAGAIGAAQIMPQYSKEFAQLCGIHDFVEKELYDLELNIVIGACQFKALLQSLNGNVAAALVAYNAGKHSMSLKELQGSRNMQNQESLNYVSRFLYVSERAKNDHKLASAIQEAN